MIIRGNPSLQNLLLRFACRTLKRLLCPGAELWQGDWLMRNPQLTMLVEGGLTGRSETQGCEPAGCISLSGSSLCSLLPAAAM